MNFQIDLMPWQRQIIADDRKIQYLIGGRQVGKSHLMYAIICSICGTRNGRSAVVCPIQTQATDFFKVMMQGDRFEELLACEPKLWPNPTMKFKSGHELEFRSFENPKRLRGGLWDGVVICDEANDLDGDDIKKVILPKVSTTNAKIYVTSSITHHNWLWDSYLKCKDGTKLEKAWLVKSDQGYCFQGEAGKKRLADIKDITPIMIYESEYECIPGVDNAVAFPYWDKCLVDEDAPKQPERDKLYIIGLDLARVQDSEVGVCIDNTGKVVEVVKFTPDKAPLDHGLMAQRFKAMSQFWNNAPVVIDATGKGNYKETLGSDKDSYIDEFYRPVIGGNSIIEMWWSPNANNNTKYDVITFLALMTEKRKLTCSKKFELLDKEMKRYSVLISKGAQSTFGPAKDSKVNDDHVSALAMAVWQGFRKKRFRSQDGGDSTLGIL